MDKQRIPTVLSIDACGEQHALPNVTDDREMMLEIQMRDVGEDITDDVIVQSTLVKNVHQAVDVVSILNIGFHISHALGPVDSPLFACLINVRTPSTKSRMNLTASKAM